MYVSAKLNSCFAYFWSHGCSNLHSNLSPWSVCTILMGLFSFMVSGLSQQGWFTFESLAWVHLLTFLFQIFLDWQYHVEPYTTVIQQTLVQDHLPPDFSLPYTTVILQLGPDKRHIINHHLNEHKPKICVNDHLSNFSPLISSLVSTPPLHGCFCYSARTPVAVTLPLFLFLGRFRATT